MKIKDVDSDTLQVWAFMAVMLVGVVLALTCCAGKSGSSTEQSRFTWTKASNARDWPHAWLVTDGRTGVEYLVVQSSGIAIAELRGAR